MHTGTLRYVPLLFVRLCIVYSESGIHSELDTFTTRRTCGVYASPSYIPEWDVLRMLCIYRLTACYPCERAGENKKKSTHKRGQQRRQQQTPTLSTVTVCTRRNGNQFECGYQPIRTRPAPFQFICEIEKTHIYSSGRRLYASRQINSFFR